MRCLMPSRALAPRPCSRSGLIIGGARPAEHLHEALRLFRAESDAHGAAQALIALSIDTDQAGEQRGRGPASPQMRWSSPGQQKTSG